MYSKTDFALKCLKIYFASIIENLPRQELRLPQCNCGFCFISVPNHQATTLRLVEHQQRYLE